MGCQISHIVNAWTPWLMQLIYKHQLSLSVKSEVLLLEVGGGMAPWKEKNIYV